MSSILRPPTNISKRKLIVIDGSSQPNPDQPASNRQRVGKSIKLKSAAITAGIVALILYFSLYPFIFRNPGAHGAIRALLETWRDWPDRADLIANVVLYIPFGFFLVQSLRLPPATRIIITALMGTALCVGIEVAQFYDRTRSLGMPDIYSNSAGALLGAMAGAFFYRARQVPLIGRMEWRPYVFLLVACWLGYRLFPYIPSVDPHKYWSALKPLVSSPQLSMLELYRETVSWLVVAMLIEALFGAIRGRLAMVLLLPAVLLARIAIGNIVLSPAEVVGGVLGVLLWIAVVGRLRARPALIAALFIGAVMLQALEPFHFLAASRRFGWIPFLSFIDSPRETAVRSFLEKSFNYGALIWLMVRAGCSLRMAAALGGGMVLGLRLAQVYLPGRSAEITDAIMLLMLAGMMKLLEEAPPAEKKGRPLPDGPAVTAS